MQGSKYVVLTTFFFFFLFLIIIICYFYYLFLFLFIFFTLQYCIGFAIHHHASATCVHMFTTFFTWSVWNFIFLLLDQWIYFWKGLSSVILFLALIPYYLDDLKKGRLKIGFMDHISVTPWSRLTKTLWTWPAPLRWCRYGQTIGHTWPCKELELRADLAVGFEDVRFWKILD